MPATESRKTAITVAADFLVYDGYGGMAEYLALGLARAGARVNLAPLTLDERGLSADLRALLARSGPTVPGPVLYSSYLRPELNRYTGRELFIHTMWESSRLPADWPARLNLARAVIVPTRFVADVCRRSGVDVPIAVVPDGVDPAVYPYVARPPRAGITTLIVGTTIPRKHVPEAVAAWGQAFAGDPDARLVIKSRFGLGATGLAGDDRIRVVTENEATRGIAQWYRDADLLLALGNEGFGLPLVEGMATGLPVIAFDAEGQGDVCRDASGAVLTVPPARFEPCYEPGVRRLRRARRTRRGRRRRSTALGRHASRRSGRCRPRGVRLGAPPPRRLAQGSRRPLGHGAACEDPAPAATPARGLGAELGPAVRGCGACGCRAALPSARASLVPDSDSARSDPDFAAPRRARGWPVQ